MDNNTVERNRRNLYTALQSEGYTGSWDDFNSRMDDDDKRRNIYNAAGMYLQGLGSWETFDGYMKYEPAETSAGAARSSAAIEPAASAAAEPVAAGAAEAADAATPVEAETLIPLTFGQVKERIARTGALADADAAANADALGRLRGKGAAAGKGYREESANARRAARRFGLDTDVPGLVVASAASEGDTESAAPASTAHVTVHDIVPGRDGNLHVQWLLPDGSVTENYVAADAAESAGRDARIAEYLASRTKSLPERIDEERERVAELKAALEERSREIEQGLAAKREESWLYTVARGLAAQESGSNSGLPADLSTALAADVNYNALLVSLHSAQESLHRMEEYERVQGQDDSGFYGLAGVGHYAENFLRSSWSEIANVDGWMLGMGGARDALALLRIANKDYDSLTEEERGALVDVLRNQDVMNEFDDLGWGARFGSIHGMSTQFGAQFALTGGFSGVTTGATKAGVRAAERVALSAGQKAAAKAAAAGATGVSSRASARAGMALAREGLAAGVAKAGGWKGLLAEQGVRGVAEMMTARTLGVSVDMAARAGLMTGMQGAGVAEDAVHNYLGGARVEDDNSIGFERNMSAAGALWEAAADHLIENASEMAGAQFMGAAELGRVLGMRRLTTQVLWRTRHGARGSISKAGAVLERMGINGVFGEIGEEQLGQVLRTALLLESSRDGEGNNLFFTSDHWIDTTLGMCMSVGMTGATAMGASKAANMVGSRMALNSAYRYGKSVFPTASRHATALNPTGAGRVSARWDSIVWRIDSSENAELGSVIKNICAGDDMTPERRDAVLRYAGAVAMQRGYNLSDLATASDRYAAAAGSRPARAYMQGVQVRSDEDRRRVVLEAEVRAGIAGELLGLEEGADAMAALVERYGVEDADALECRIDKDGSLSEQQRLGLRRYVYAESRVRGMRATMEDELRALRDEAEGSFRARADFSGAEPVVRRAVLAEDGSEVFITGGRVAVNDDGSVNRGESDSFIMVVDAAGSVRSVGPAELLSASEPAPLESEVNGAVAAAVSARRNEIESALAGFGADKLTEGAEVFAMRTDGEVVKLVVRGYAGGDTVMCSTEGSDGAIAVPVENIVQTQRAYERAMMLKGCEAVDEGALKQASRAAAQTTAEAAQTQVAAEAAPTQVAAQGGSASVAEVSAGGQSVRLGDIVELTEDAASRLGFDMGEVVAVDRRGDNTIINLEVEYGEGDSKRVASIRPEDVAAVERGDGAAESERISGVQDPRTMSESERGRRGDMLRDAHAETVEEGVISARDGKSARKVAEQWWDENVGQPVFFNTEIGEVEINRTSVESSLAHRYGQMKLDAISSLVDGFGNAVYIGTLPDFSRQEGVVNHYFAYPIVYKGERCYVFCRTMQDANKNRLYVHEVFIADNIKQGDTLQTAAFQPHGGIALYRDILANVLELSESEASERKDSDSLADKQASGEESSVRPEDVAAVERGGRGAEGREDAEKATEKESNEAILSGEYDDNELPLLTASDGSTSFGSIRDGEGIRKGPIKLSLGFNTVVTVDGREVNRGYGYEHIEAQRGDDIRDSGFSGVSEFVEYVSKNYTAIRKGRKRNGKDTFIIEVVRPDGKDSDVLYIELSAGEEYWTVNSGGVFRASYTKNKELVERAEDSDNSLPAIETSPATVDGKVQDAAEGGNLLSGNSSLSESSERKDSDSLADKQASGEESSVRPEDVAAVERGDGAAEGRVAVRATTEVAEQGERGYVLCSDGSEEFGYIDAARAEAIGIGREAPIKLQFGTDGFGLKHMEKRLSELKANGYNSVEEFAEDVCRNYREIRQGNLYTDPETGETKETYLLVKPLTTEQNKKGGVLYIEFVPEGDVYVINSGGVFKNSYISKRKELWNAGTEHSTTSGESQDFPPAQDMPESDGVSALSRSSSVGKVTTSSADKQEDAEKSSDASGGSALSLIPVDEATQRRQWTAVEPETAWDGLVEAMGGVDGALPIVQQMIDDAAKDLEKLRKKPPTPAKPRLAGKGSPEAMLEERQRVAQANEQAMVEYQRKLAEAEAKVQAWRRIKAVYNLRKAVERERIEEERRRQNERGEAAMAAALEAARLEAQERERRRIEERERRDREDARREAEEARPERVAVRAADAAFEAWFGDGQDGEVDEATRRRHEREDRAQGAKQYAEMYSRWGQADSLEEWLAREMSTMKERIKWGGPKGLGRQLYGREDVSERKDLRWTTSEANGLSFDEFVHCLYERFMEAPDVSFNNSETTDADVRDAVLEMFRTAPTSRQMYEVALEAQRRRERMEREAEEGVYNSAEAREYWYLEQFNMTPAEFEAYEEQLYAELSERAAESEDYEAYVNSELGRAIDEREAYLEHVDSEIGRIIAEEEAYEEQLRAQLGGLTEGDAAALDAAFAETEQDADGQFDMSPEEYRDAVEQFGVASYGDQNTINENHRQDETEQRESRRTERGSEILPGEEADDAAGGEGAEGAGPASTGRTGSGHVQAVQAKGGGEHSGDAGRDSGRSGDMEQTETEITAPLSDSEKDEFGKPFVTSSDGTTTFGFVDPESGLASLPIRLSLGENHKDENGKNHGYGWLHIDAGHRAEILNAGFSSIEEFVESVARNYTDIREGAVIANNQTYLLEVSDEHNNTLFIQLSRDGRYWNVNSAGIFKKRYSRRKPEVYSRPAVGSGKGTDTTEVDSGQSKGATAPAGNSSETSVGKVTTSSADKQEAGEESSDFERGLADFARRYGAGKERVSVLDREFSEWMSGRSVEELADLDVNMLDAVCNAAGLDAGKAWAFRMSIDKATPKEKLSEVFELRGQRKAAGNYKMEHRRVDGHNVSIENPKGSVRRGKGEDGKEWQTTMQNDYGYIRGTEGVDGDHIDVFLSDTPEQGDVFVIDQLDKDGNFDEHKVMYGFPSAEAAREAYLSNYEPGWTGLGAITHVSKEEFKKWLGSSKRKTKPFADYKNIKTIEDEIGRSLTEEEATSILSQMENIAEEAPDIAFTPENWKMLFGEDGKISTPIGVVKMGENQYGKLALRGRTSYFGMIHPTLTEPHVIIEKNAPAKEAERNSKYLFIRTFKKPNGGRIVHFESITVMRDGMEVSISSHEATAKDIKKDMQNEKILHISEKLSLGSEKSLTEAPKNTEGPDLVPTSDDVSSAGKGSESSSDAQGRGAAKAARQGQKSKTPGGQNGRIEDFGEKIEGARKDMLNTLAKSVENATEQSLIELPLSKSFTRPNLKKMVESGAITDSDALWGEAILQSMVYAHRKPVVTRRASSKRAVAEWAKNVRRGIVLLGEVLSGDPTRREAALAEHRKLLDAERDATNAHIEKIREWNPGKEFKDVSEMPDPLEVTRRVLEGIGYRTGESVKLPLTNVELNTTGQSYVVGSAGKQGALWFRRSHNTLDEAIDTMVLAAKIARGDRDVELPVRQFVVAGMGSRHCRPTGKYEVMYFGTNVWNVKTRVFNTKEEADAFAEKRSGHSRVFEQTRGTDEYDSYGIKVVNPLTGESYTIRADFGSRDEAAAWLDESHDEANKLALDALYREMKVDGPSRSHFRVETAYLHGKRAYRVVENSKNNPWAFVKYFNTREEADTWYAANVNRLEAERKARREKESKVVYFNTDEERHGVDRRGGKDATPQMFDEAFGFRGVQFGNWTNSADRQAALNQAYDALMDLADFLGVSTRALSLDGQLGLAFGARGSGWAAAHYEPVQVVINLTKTKGAGALAHEWWHAVDNFMSRNAGVPLGYASEFNGIDNMHPEIRRAMAGLMDAVGNSAYAKRSRDKGEYWGRPTEFCARLFESWVSTGLKERGEANPFLSSLLDRWAMEMFQSGNYSAYVNKQRALAEHEKRVPEIMSKEEFFKLPESLRGYPYPTPEEIKAFGTHMQTLFDAMAARESESGSMVNERGGRYRRRGSTVVGKSLFDWADEEEQRRRQSEVADEKALAAQGANTACDEYAEAYDHYLDRVAELERQLAEADENSEEAFALRDVIELEENAAVEARERLVESLRDYYGADNTSADASRIARDMAARIQAEVDIRRNKERLLTDILPDNRASREADSAPTASEDVSVRTAGGYISYDAQGHLPDAEAGEFAYVERQFSRTGEFGFTGSEVIRDRGDVAYLFRALEDYSIENVFAVFVKDGRAKVQHIGMGGPAASFADLGAVRAGMDAFGADKIYLVHNHPSGSLTASVQDQKLVRALEAAFEGEAEVEGIIIDTTSGRYAVFTGRGETEQYDRGHSGEERPVDVVRLQHAERLGENESPVVIRQSSDVADFVTARRLGGGKKVSYLVLSTNNTVVGNFHTEYTSLDAPDLAEEMVSVATKYGGTRVVVYGNVSISGASSLGSEVSRLSASSVRLLDAMAIDDRLVASAIDTGLMRESGEDYVPRVEDSGAEAPTVGDSEASPASVSGTKNAERREAALKHLEPSSISNDAAKVDNNFDICKARLREVASKYRNIKDPKGFLTDLGDALGLTTNVNGSGYRAFELQDGRTLVVRVSNHNANAENAGEEPVVSVVIKSKRSKNRFVAADSKEVVEYVYMKEDIRESPDGTLSSIAESVEELLSTGVYIDRTGLARENRSPKENPIRYRDSNISPDGAGSKTTEAQAQEAMGSRAMELGKGESMTDGERLLAIRALEPVEVEKNNLSRAELREIYNNLPSVKKDGAEIAFYRSAFKKIYKDDGLFGQVVPVLDKVLAQSVLAYSEKDNLGGTVRPDGTVHKKHPNVDSFDNYVGKVEISGREYYVRTTIQRSEKSSTGTHSFMVTQVDVYEKTANALSLPITTRARGNEGGNQSKDGLTIPKFPSVENANPIIVDAKLQQFFERASLELREDEGAADGDVRYRTSEETERSVNDRANTDVRAMAERASELGAKLGVRVRVVENVDDIVDDNADDAADKRAAKGWFDIATGEVVVVVPNNANVADAEATVLHEVVGHKGLRELVGEERFDAFLDEVYGHADSEVRAEIHALMARNGWDVRLATEEYIASLAERGFEDMNEVERGFWQRVCDAVRRVLDAVIGGAGVPSGVNIGQNEIRYMLWRAYQQRQNRGIVGEAENVVMQERLGVGRYRDEELSGENFGDDVEAVNARFNEQLQRWESGELRPEETIDVGYPVRVMQQFMPHLPILIRQKVLSKSRKKHNLTAADMRGLPKAMANPIFVFKSNEETVSMLTELKSAGGKNIFVAVELHVNPRMGGRMMEVNDILTIHGREVENVVLPIVENGTLVWVDKKKGLEWLHSAKSNSQAITAQTLDDAAKVVKTFENPTAVSEKSSIRYSDEELSGENFGDDVEAVNARFNEQLQRQIDGTLPAGHVYDMGMPGDTLLAAGFPDAVIELSAKQLALKAEKRNHEFDISDVRDLPREIQTPIAVFRYGERSKAENVIVGLMKDGKQFVVGVHFNQSRRGTVVSDIRGLFPKDNAEWLNWIIQGKSEWLDKEKIQALIDQQRTNLAEVEYLDLEALAKVVNSFENPSIKPKKSSIRYSDEELSGENFGDDVEAAANISRGLEAMSRIAGGEEEVADAMVRADLSDYGGTAGITFVFGRPGDATRGYKGGFGLSHIGAKHGRDSLLSALDVIAKGYVERYVDGNKTVVLSNGKYEVVLCLTKKRLCQNRRSLFL